MKWFGRKAARTSARPFLLRGLQGPAAGEWPRSYEAQVRDAFLANPIAQRAVRLVAEGCGSAVVYDAGTQAPPPSFGQSPSPRNRGEGLVAPALIETVAAQLLLHGNAFVQILCDAEGEPASLFPLRPERVSVEPDASGWPAAYLYKAGAAKSRLAARDGLGRPSLAHIKALHPLDDHYGLGCLGAAAGAVAIHNAATRWNKALLDNAARPSGALVFDPGDGAAMAPDQFDRLRGRRGTEWAAESHVIGEPFVLIEAEALAFIEPPLTALGGETRLLAAGIGDGPEGANATCPISGEALRSPAPVHLTAEREANGDITIQWVRRSRNGWAWTSGSDTPLGEEREAYRLTLSTDGFMRSVELTEPSFLYTNAEQAADGLAGPLGIEVVQLGTHASSRSAFLIYSQGE